MHFIGKYEHALKYILRSLILSWFLLNILSLCRSLAIFILVQILFQPEDRKQVYVICDYYHVMFRNIQFLQVYISHICAILEYTCEVWYPGITLSQVHDIERVQIRVLFIIRTVCWIMSCHMSCHISHVLSHVITYHILHVILYITC